MQNSATPNVKRKTFGKRENNFSAQVFPTEEETQVAKILGLEGVGQVNKIRHFNVNTRLLQQIYLLHFFSLSRRSLYSSKTFYRTLSVAVSLRNAFDVTLVVEDTTMPCFALPFVVIWKLKFGQDIRLS